jgi:hypothetical protein
MDKQRQEQNSPGRQQTASDSRAYDDAAGSGSGTSGLREKSVDEDIVPGERDLDTADRIERLKEDADLDRIK